MLNLKKKKKLLYSRVLKNKKKTKLRISRTINEPILIDQLVGQKKEFNLLPKKNLSENKQDSKKLISRINIKRVNSINASVKKKNRELVFMSFKQVEQKFIGHIMQKGLRAKALAIWMRLLLLIKMHFYKAAFNISVSSVIMRALDILKPIVILKKRKIAGTVYEIPYFVQNIYRDNSMLIAIRWFLECVGKRIERDPAVCLYKEFIDVLRKQGLAYKKKKEIYELAVKNRIYTRFLFSKSRKKRKL